MVDVAPTLCASTHPPNSRAMARPGLPAYVLHHAVLATIDPQMAQRAFQLTGVLTLIVLAAATSLLALPPSPVKLHVRATEATPGMGRSASPRKIQMSKMSHLHHAHLKKQTARMEESLMLSNVAVTVQETGVADSAHGAISCANACMDHRCFLVKHLLLQQAKNPAAVFKHVLQTTVKEL